MHCVKVGIILALFLCAATLQSCGSMADGNVSNTGNKSTSANSQDDNSNSPKSNAEELGLLINLSYDTDESLWKEDAANKKLTAVLRFTPADANTVVSQAEKIRAPQEVEIATETWFPGELIAQSELSGDGNLKGRSYAANDFFQEP
jgi:hypothetical protein